jgi:hypothetical protein
MPDNFKSADSSGKLAQLLKIIVFFMICYLDLADKAQFEGEKLQHRFGPFSRHSQD